MSRHVNFGGQVVLPYDDFKCIVSLGRRRCKIVHTKGAFEINVSANCAHASLAAYERDELPKRRAPMNARPPTPPPPPYAAPVEEKEKAPHGIRE